MRTFYRKIKSLFNKGKLRESIHYKNIKKGKTLTIDGKEYVKVKLRFVDTLNYEASKTIDNLETEIELLNEKVEKLSDKSIIDQNRILLLQTLNTNLLNSEKNQKAKLNHKISNINAINEKLVQKIRDLQSKIGKQEQQITNILKLNNWQKQTNKEKANEYEKLEHKVHNQHFQKEAEDMRKLNKKLNDKVVSLTSEIDSLKAKLLQQETLNKNMFSQFTIKKQKSN